MRPPLSRLALLALAVGALLRAMRVPLRWTEVSWQYAAYPAPTGDALAEGRLADALTGFVGLHPPLFPLLHALEERLWPAPGLFLGGSALMSLGAVALLARRHPVAALLVAGAPVAVHYAAEINNYPLLALVVAGAYAERARVRAGEAPWRMALWGALAVWTHGLAAFTVGAAALTLRRRGLLVLGAMALALLPLVPSVLDRIADSGTYMQPEYKPELVFPELFQRFGAAGLLVLPFAARGARKDPGLALATLATAAFVLALQLAHVAAPHQAPYLLALGAPLALLAAEAEGPFARRTLVTLALVQALWQGVFDAQRLMMRADPTPRAIDVALAESAPGDGIYLLRPAPVNDDDKRILSPVLRRFPLARALPMAHPYPFAYDDYRHGQPRLFEGRTVYVNDEVREELALAIAAHPHLWLISYDHGGDPRFTRGLAERLGHTAEQVGEDWLFRLP